MAKGLTVEIHSFSYKKGGIPQDMSGNGGGFAFDCRGILNPGRIEEYKTQTGREIGVQRYLETETAMPQFLESVKNILKISLENYLSRGFENLQINFGCTGGQHRSVYAAEKTAQWIRAAYPEVKLLLQHDEQPQLSGSDA